MKGTRRPIDLSTKATEISKMGPPGKGTEILNIDLEKVQKS